MTEENKKRMELLTKLGKGEVKSDDPHVNHVLDKLREKGAESMVVKGQYDQAVMVAEKSETRLIELDAECRSLGEDVLTFYEMSLEKDKK